MRTIAAVTPVVVNISPKTNWTFVEVAASDGATGWGECSLNGWEPLLVAQAQMLARDAVGRDVDAVGDLVAYLPHTPGGLVAHAVKSAVEQALTDLRARANGVSVATMLAASPRAAVPAYANINRSVVDRAPASFADAARRAVAAGYRAVKLAPFDGVIAADAAHTPIDARTRAGLDRVFAVRDAVGADVAVMVDCHWRFDVDRAEALLRDIAPAKPYWIECMISEHPLGFGSIARLTELAHAQGMRTAGGETIAGADAALAMCAGRLYDVLMPDIKYAGGFAGMQAIAGVCAGHGVDYAPHNPTGPIAHVASVHACAAAPTLLWLEHQWNESPLFGALVDDALPPLRDGAFAVPSAAGLGAALDRAIATAHPYQALAAGANLDPRLG
ncbi:MAG: mandelate racemase/muconate lactonizing enzyme family protein [Burkholderiales bacterium]